MNGQDDSGQLSPEQRVAQLFEATGHDVSQVAGSEPGTVDFFATLRTGFVRPRTYWRTWERCPEDLAAALDELERMRRAHQADRGLAVLMEGRLPPGYQGAPDHTNQAITFRRLMLELSGVTDAVRNFVERYEHSEECSLFLPRRGRTEAGDVVDAVACIESWVHSEDESSFVVLDAESYLRSAVIEHAAYKLGFAFLEDPETKRPLMKQSISTGSRMEAFRQRVAVRVMPPRGRADDRVLTWWPGGLKTFDARIGWQHLRWMELLPPESYEIERWFESRLASENREIFLDAHRRYPSLRELTAAVTNLPTLLAAARNTPPTASVAEWVARVIADYATKALERLDEPRHSSAIEQAAFEQFALGRDSAVLDYSTNALVEKGWLAPSENTRSRSGRIANTLIRDYFIARKVAAEVRLGRPEILTRYQFPREHVLLFLAIIAPEVAAQASADRSAEMRASIETEVERRLQLTLAHMLRRSAGAVRSHIKTIRKAVERRLPGSEASELLPEFTRIEQELSLQCALAEKTRLLHEVPEATLVDILVEPVLTEVVAHLKGQYPGVECAAVAEPTIRVRATQDGLREVLSCLLENAFQAVAFSNLRVTPRVDVQVTLEGATVRIDVLDNGPGVAAEDRERIFEPHITTKKGGEGKPLGTGMGLTIARRYAERMGGRVELDPSREGTCFCVRLVTWKD